MPSNVGRLGSGRPFLSHLYCERPNSNRQPTTYNTFVEHSNCFLTIGFHFNHTSKMKFLFSKLNIKVIFSLLINFARFCDISCEYNSDHSGDNGIEVDVAIIGGGSTGTYSAIQLQASGRSVALIERKDALGGHTDTYTDPETNTAVDYGVETFEDIDVVKEYFKYLDVPWFKSTYNETSNIFVDFSTGKTCGDAGLMAQDIQSGRSAYIAQLKKYPTILKGFFLPDPIPEELLLPFEEYLEKYPDIKPAVFELFQFGQGLGDFLRLPALYVLKGVNINALSGIINGFIFTANRDNSVIYRNAYNLLKDSVLLQSRPVIVNRRSSKRVDIIVQTPTGLRKVKAKKLLVTIPPKLENLVGFDLSSQEKRLFGQFRSAGYYTSLVSDTGITGNDFLYNVNCSGSYNLPRLPALYYVGPSSVPGLFQIKYGSLSTIPDATVKRDILASLNLLAKQKLAKKTKNGPKFKAFRSHSPFGLTVPVQSIKNGFYGELYNLQGERNTFYSGAALDCQDSSAIWSFTKYNVLPLILKSLQ